MAREKSCGGILFTRDDGGIKYLIIENCNGCYGFPKGHVEGSEAEEETALREIYEEVGIRPTLIAGFREVDEHEIPGVPGVVKQVVYFLGEYSDQEIKYPEEEISDAFLAPFDEVLALLQFDRIKEIFRQANEFVVSMS